ncbi:MAG: PIN domain-containing protein, partial [Terracidiphilus sp.]
MAKTVLENLRAEAEQIRKLLKELLALSSIERDRDSRTSGLVFLNGDFWWTPLKEPGRQIQAKVLEEYRRFYSTIRVLLREQPEDSLGKMAEADGTILKLIQQQGALCTADCNSYFTPADEALESLIGLLDRLYGQPDGRAQFVPDTNALISNPAIEKWKFDEADQFSIIFTAPVLSELDSLKVNHRNEAVREKAERVSKYPPAEPVALRLLAPQRGLTATVRSKSKNKSKSLSLLSS